MDGFMQYSYTNFLNDPFNKLHTVNGPKSREWNEYQKGAKLNALETKFPYSRDHLVRLASTKRGIYNPALPTLRKIDRDDVLCKLSDEHSRHTTFLDKDSFQSSSIFFNYPSGRHPLVERSLGDLWSDLDKPERKTLRPRVKTGYIPSKKMIDLEFSYGSYRKFPEPKESIEKLDDLKISYATFKDKVHNNITNSI
ncbi:unnamed protein product [Brachionus calyciflorus]|uniref:Uncharacterized protein n=1 Tax=Brachionus calyciflorus TaxID=104777 RepID=A0A813PHQ0_9BILA|nr:unnamed protein product [Brachionus calyciflorus]